jgi:predicted PolB exonuclease-like 3'-5' exonuclease
MLKSAIPELCLFFDLEWVPDAVGAMRLYELPAETTELEAMQKLWERSPQYNADSNPRPFLKYMFSRVVSIAFLSRRCVYDSDREPSVEFRLQSLPELPCENEPPDEAELIHKFLYNVGKQCPQLVGYNSEASDLQVLIQRGLINEVSAPAFCERPNKPWEGRDYFDARNSEAHLDLAKRFSGGAMMPKLDELAKLCGFPGKIDVKGDQVTDLWLERNISKIVEYNQIDALNTYLVWLRMAYFAGKIEEEMYIEEQDGFRAFLHEETQKPEKAFVANFLARWPE